MKKILLILIVASFVNSAKSQIIFPIDSATRKISYDSVVVSPLKKEELFSNASSWFATEFKSGKDVIQSSDAANGKIIGKGAIEQSSDVFLEFVITVMMRDDKYKYTLTDFVQRTSYGDYPLEMMLKADGKTVKGVNMNKAESANEKIKELISSLNTAMLKQENKW